MNLHEPQWLERGLTVGALFVSNLVAKVVKKDRLARALVHLEVKLDGFAETVGEHVKGIYRRLGRVESHIALTPSPFKRKTDGELDQTGKFPLLPEDD